MITIDLTLYAQRIEQERLALLQRLAYLDGQAALLRELLAAGQGDSNETTRDTPAAAGSDDDAGASGGGSAA